MEPCRHFRVQGEATNAEVTIIIQELFCFLVFSRRNLNLISVACTGFLRRKHKLRSWRREASKRRLAQT